LYQYKTVLYEEKIYLAYELIPIEMRLFHCLCFGKNISQEFAFVEPCGNDLENQFECHICLIIFTKKHEIAKISSFFHKSYF